MNCRRLTVAAVNCRPMKCLLTSHHSLSLSLCITVNDEHLRLKKLTHSSVSLRRRVTCDQLYCTLHSSLVNTTINKRINLSFPVQHFLSELLLPFLAYIASLKFNRRSTVYKILHCLKNATTLKRCSLKL